MSREAPTRPARPPRRALPATRRRSRAGPSSPLMAQLCHTPTHAVDHVRRGLYLLRVWDRCPNPTGRHLVVWYHGNRRNAFRYLDQLLALPVSFRGSGERVPALAPASGVCEPPAAYRAGGASGDIANGPRVPLGRVVATRGALDLAREHGLDLLALLHRHQSGDWGDVCAADAQANDLAFDPALAARLLSAYDTAAGRLWIITEADRSATTVLLPSEY